jgi:hypothetical protein
MLAVRTRWYEDRSVSQLIRAKASNAIHNMLAKQRVAANLGSAVVHRRPLQLRSFFGIYRGRHRSLETAEGAKGRIHRGVIYAPGQAAVSAPNYFRAPGELDTFSVYGMFQGLRRRLRAAPDNWFAALVAGVVDISYNREADGREFWTPHIHLAVAVDADSSEIKRVFKPRRDPPAEYMGTNFRAVVVKQVTRLSNSIIEGRRSSWMGVRTSIALDSRSVRRRHLSMISGCWE